MWILVVGGSLTYANVLIRKDERRLVKDDLDNGMYEYWSVMRAELETPTGRWSSPGARERQVTMSDLVRFADPAITGVHNGPPEERPRNKGANTSNNKARYTAEDSAAILRDEPARWLPDGAVHNEEGVAICTGRPRKGSQNVRGAHWTARKGNPAGLTLRRGSTRTTNETDNSAERLRRRASDARVGCRGGS